jgi:5-methylcytosine-specific restriction endonuclease McrA
MLSSIPDRELIARLHELRRSERDVDLDLLHHLNEVQRRSLHLRLGYASLFAYCTGHLCYSESDAGRRVQAARCLLRFPRVESLLKSGDVNLTTLGLVANIVTESTIDAWLERIRGKTQREVEALAATVRPPITLRDRARVVHVPVPAVSPLPLAPEATPSKDASTADESLFTPPPVSAAPPAPDEPDAVASPAAPVKTEPKVYIQFLVDRSFMVKYRAAIALLSNRLPRLTFETAFTALLDEFLRRHEPVERHHRRERERESAQQAEAGSRAAIPARTRDAVFARDRGRCTFVGSDGRRCNETLRLHIDHIKPVARGGSNDISNLRLLCAQHNRLQAERLLGRTTMAPFLKREPE